MEEKNTELEEMRSQLNLLKAKLDSQQIVNERLVRSAMLHKMSFLQRYTWISFVTLFFVCLIFLPIREKYGISWWFYGFTVLVLTADVLGDWYINRYSKTEFMDGNLLKVSERMVRMRRLRRWSGMIGLPLLITWGLWMAMEVTHGPAGTSLDAIGFLVSGSLGGVIGIGIGLDVFFKMQRINREVIQQIEELRNNAAH